MVIITYRELNKNEINVELFSTFDRYQEVTKCWRKVDGEWVIKDVVFTEQWTADDYVILVDYLVKSAVVIGAFNEKSKLVGFTSLEHDFFGETCKYIQMSCLHTSYGYRGQGIGKRLFTMICDAAKNMGADKLYISAHSSIESQAFYKAVGCVEAVEYNARLVELEPVDCQLEYQLI